MVNKVEGGQFLLSVLREDLFPVYSGHCWQSLVVLGLSVSAFLFPWCSLCVSAFLMETWRGTSYWLAESFSPIPGSEEGSVKDLCGTPPEIPQASFYPGIVHHHSSPNRRAPVPSVPLANWKGPTQRATPPAFIIIEPTAVRDSRLGGTALKFCLGRVLT